MKKLLTLTLALIMAFSIASVWSAIAENPETVDLTLYRAIFSASPQGTPTEDEWLRMQEEYLGVKLNITWIELPWGEFNSRMSVYMAAGDWADAFLISNYSYANINDFGQQGMLLALNEYLPEDSYYMDYVNESLKNKTAATAADGNIYGFLDGAVSINDAGTQSCWAARFDILEENGLKPPESMEEIYEAAKALKAIYPESYPVTIKGGIGRWLTLNKVDMSIVFDGEKYVYSPYRDADAIYEIIEYLNKLYVEGLLDPEWNSETDDQMYTKFLTGVNFISSHIWGSVYSERINYNEEYDVTWGMLNVPTNLKGEPGYRYTEHEIGKRLITAYSIVVNAATKYPELVVKMLDYQYSDDMVHLTNWGIEGLTYIVGEDGELDYAEEIKKAPLPSAKLAEYGVNQSMSCRSGMIFLPQLNDAACKLQVPNPYYYKGEFGDMVHWDFYTMVRKDADNVMPLAPARTAFDDLDNEDLSINKTALDTYVLEELTKFIMGERPLDTYQAYLDEMPNFGNIDLVEEIYNKHIITE
jgi:putative aldouronate transport system substrate-binding protein